MAVQRVVRAHYSAFQRCYDAGLARTPKLKGRVNVRFAIGRRGNVTDVEDAGSELPDATVVQCVETEFRGLEFPAPVGGIVTVVSPIMLEPPAASATAAAASTAPATTTPDVTTSPAPSDGAASGRLPPELIQSVVREHYGVFRRCYEAALAHNPVLKGRVSARFVIDRDGKVTNVGDAGSDLPDPPRLGTSHRASRPGSSRKIELDVRDDRNDCLCNATDLLGRNR